MESYDLLARYHVRWRYHSIDCAAHIMETNAKKGEVMSDIYVGRLVADGQGNLLADEGDRAGDPVAFHEGSYVFIQPDEPSHNERHETQVLEVIGTTDENEEGQEHHAGPLEDDPHYDADAENNTKLRQLPDKVSAKLTGHTEAYRG